jgi:hypothetical protein
MSIFTDHKVTRRSLLFSTCCLVPGIPRLKRARCLGDDCTGLHREAGAAYPSRYSR